MMWRLDRAKMWSLGHFTVPPPPNGGMFELAHWEAEFITWLLERVSEKYVYLQIRSPDHSYSALSAMLEMGATFRNQGLIDVADWHQDVVAPSSTHLGLWSNTIATELRVKRRKSGVVYQAEPCEVVLFDNKFFEHRPPYEQLTLKSAATRWFVRFDTGKALRDHADVLECTL